MPAQMNHSVERTEASSQPRRPRRATRPRPSGPGLQLIVAAVVVLTGGCSLTGSWRVVSTSPRDQTFPFSTVTFAEDRYTATGEDGDDGRTSTGTFRWNGRQLTIHPADGGERVYPGRKTVGGRLVLRHRYNDAEIEATFEKTADESGR